MRENCQWLLAGTKKYNHCGKGLNEKWRDMFEDDDDDDDEGGLSEFESWFDDNRYCFPKDLQKDGSDDLEVYTFYTNVYLKVMSELVPQIRKLLYKQYPLIKTETRPMVVASVEDIIDYMGHSCLLNLFCLVYDQKTGVNLREKYPDFDRWVVFYARPATPRLQEISFYDGIPGLSDEDKQELVDEENREELKGFRWVARRQRAFIDVLQTPILKHYKAILDLDSDSWIIYSVHVREEYEYYKFRCEHIVSFIRYEFPEEDIKLKYSDFYEKFKKVSQEMWEKRPEMLKYEYDDEDDEDDESPGN